MKGVHAVPITSPTDSLSSPDSIPTFTPRQQGTVDIYWYSLSGCMVYACKNISPAWDDIFSCIKALLKFY